MKSRAHLGVPYERRPALPIQRLLGKPQIDEEVAQLPVAGKGRRHGRGSRKLSRAMERVRSVHPSAVLLHSEEPETNLPANQRAAPTRDRGDASALSACLTCSLSWLDRISSSRMASTISFQMCAKRVCRLVLPISRLR